MGGVYDSKSLVSVEYLFTRLLVYGNSLPLIRGRGVYGDIFVFRHPGGKKSPHTLVPSHSGGCHGSKHDLSSYQYYTRKVRSRVSLFERAKWTFSYMDNDPHLSSQVTILDMVSETVRDRRTVSFLRTLRSFLKTRSNVYPPHSS